MMQTGKRFLAVLLACLMVFGSFGMIGSAKGNAFETIEPTGTATGTVTYGLDIYKVDDSGDLTKLSDGERLSPGDVVEVQLCFGTDFYLGYLSTEIYYDSTYFAHYLDGAVYVDSPTNTFTVASSYIKMLIDGAPTANTVNGYSVTLFDTVAPIDRTGYQGWVNKAGNTSAENQWTPMVWRAFTRGGKPVEKLTAANDILEEYRKYNFVGLALTCNAESSTGGYEICVPYAPYFSFRLVVKEDADSCGETTPIFIPMDAVKRTSLETCNRLYATECTDGVYTTKGLPTFGQGYDLQNADVDFLIQSHAHTFVLTEHKDANCTEDGYDLYTCSECGQTYTEPGEPARGHEYDCRPVVEPSCTKNGYYVYVCAVCGDVYGETIPAKGHTPGEVVIENAVEPTCAQSGSYDKTVYCADCGVIISRETVVIPALDHTPGDVVIENDTAPTCETDGGYDAVVYCTACGTELSREMFIVAATGHTPGDAVIDNTVEPGCETTGSYDSIVYCTVCGKMISCETVTVPALGHDYVPYVTKPTCTESGYTVYICSRCNAGYTADFTEPLGHAYNADVTQPSCTKGGYTTFTCTRCSNRYVGDETDPLGHAYDALTIEPSCTQGGCTVFTCTRCGNSYTTDEKPALGHDFSEWTIEKPYAADGTFAATRTCGRCGKQETIDNATLSERLVLETADVRVGNNAGRRVHVPVYVRNNPGVISTRLEIEYDQTQLQLIDVKDGGLFGKNKAVFGGDLSAVPYSILWSDDNAAHNNTKTGVLVTFTFEVLPGAEAGVVPLRLICDGSNTLNTSLQLVPEFTVPGSVEITDDFIPGDASGDGAITLLDSIMISRYLAGGWAISVNGINADVNGDGTLDLKDVILIRRFLVGGWGVELR